MSARIAGDRGGRGSTQVARSRPRPPPAAIQRADDLFALRNPVAQLVQGAFFFLHSGPRALVRLGQSRLLRQGAHLGVQGHQRGVLLGGGFAVGGLGVAQRRQPVTQRIARSFPARFQQTAPSQRIMPRAANRAIAVEFQPGRRVLPDTGSFA